MTSTTKLVIAGTVVIAIAGVGGSLWWRGPNLPTVAAETLRKRDLEAIVSASGKIQPQRQVNVSANTMGRVTRLAVNEGEHVREGQLLLEIDPRLERRENERIVRKKYASSFKATNLLATLATLGVDTLIVTGVSTSHCVYATCRDAAHTFNVIVPREAVGERCEIMHEVNLLDIDIDLGDVMPLEEVIAYLEGLAQ